MSNRCVPALSRGIGEASAHRRSLLAIGGAIAARAWLAIDAGGKDGKNRRKTCNTRIAPCRQLVAAMCASTLDPAACRREAFACCKRLTACSGGTILGCFPEAAT